jgi:LysM repeat protein
MPPTAPALPTPPAQGGAIYIVRSGDTVSAIARRFNVTAAAIAVANSLEDPNRIRAGQRLVIPKPAAVLSVAEAMAVTEASKPRGGVLGVGDASTPVVSPREIQEFLEGKRTMFYVARKGDTIPRVAAIFKMEPLVLSQINQVGMEGEMIPGTRLIIPMK